MTADADFFVDVLEQVTRKRMHFPTNTENLSNLTETNGQIATALIAVNCGEGAHSTVWNECVRTAAMAMRVATEGNASWKYKPPTEDDP